MIPQINTPTSIYGGHAIGHRYSTRSWAVDYDRVQASSDSTFIQIDGVHHAVLFRRGKPALRLNADHANINIISKDFSVQGHVHIWGAIGGVVRTFDTTTAMWSESTQQLSMPAVMRLGGRGAVLTIQDATIDAKSGQIHLGRINGDVKP